MKYRTVILGATYAGIGMLSAADESCILLERRKVAGSDFLYSLKSFETLEKTPWLYEQAKGKNILFGITVESIVRRDNGFEITAYGVSGRYFIEAERVIDTEVRDEWIIDRSLNYIAVTKGVSGSAHLGRIEHIRDMEDGRNKLREKIEAAEGLMGIRYIADEPDVVTEPDICAVRNGVECFPSVSYGEPMRAFEAGKKYMQTAAEPAFDGEYDVIIAGLGTGGSIALSLCSELGLKTLGIEATDCMGGMASSGEIPSHYFGIDGGYYENIDREIDEMAKKTGFSTQARKLVCEKKARESGAAFLYDSSVCEVFTDAGHVTGVKVLTPKGVRRYACRVLMDGTSDGLICELAGCSSKFGRDIDGKAMPYTMCGIRDSADGSFVNANFDFGRVDQRSDEAISKAIVFSRSFELYEAARWGKLLYQGTMLGMREGRRVDTVEMMKASDILEGRFTATPAFYSWADLDKHGWDNAFDGEVRGDWAVGANLGALNLTIPVPFGALIPKDVEGLLICSRCFGMDNEVAGAVRMSPDVKKAAEAASYIAYLAKKHGCRLKDIPYAELAEMLRKSGCLGYDRDLGTWNAGWRDENFRLIEPTPVHWIEEPEKLNESLSTLTPGVAIWSCRRMGLEKCEKVLTENLRSSDGNLRRHSAFALALCGSTPGKDELAAVIRERDCTLLKDCRKNNQRRLFMAIYHAGRLGLGELTDELTAFLNADVELNRDAVDNGSSIRYKVRGFDNELFQTVSESVMALIRIGEADPERRPAIRAAFHKAFDDDALIRRIADMPQDSSEYDMAKNVADVALRLTEGWERA